MLRPLLFLLDRRAEQSTNARVIAYAGGRVTGFLYFEGVEAGTGRVRLLADFPDPETGKRITRLAIPFLLG